MSSKSWELCVDSSASTPYHSVSGITSIYSSINRIDVTFFLRRIQWSSSIQLGDYLYWTSLVAQWVKRLSTMWETWVRSQGWEDSLEKKMATHSSTLALKIPWTEELGASYYPWGRKESGTTERLHFHFNDLWEGNGTPLQYSCLENPMGGGAWWAAVHGVARSRTQLSDFNFTFPFHALEKEMATHSTVLAWTIPGTGEPGGLPSMGSHRVGHNWSDLAAAAAKVL